MVFFSAGGDQFARGQHESVSVSSHSEGNSKSKEFSLKYLNFGPIFIHREKGKGDVNVIAKGSL